jgi:phage shock protein PspC (stress-responsive transcriptional regulator)
MNKIININLAGRLIPIDEQAYELLNNYITRLKNFFAREQGGDEIVRDMEDRIGELFQDKLKKGASCIMAEDIKDMMDIMGSPEQIEHETGDDRLAQEDVAKGTDKEQQAYTKTSRLSLARNKKDKILGGVCGGLANHFNIDPIILRIAMVLITLAWGSGLLIYLLLWLILPERAEEISITRKRLYRNPAQKVVGGVCSGIAAYTGVDPIIPRVIFAAPLLGLIFFGVLNSNIFFFPVFLGGLPTLVLLYIILWASLPEATTIAEKLEMRGEKVDVQSLSHAIKTSEPAKTSQPKRPVLVRLFSILVKLFVFLVLTFILIVLAGVLIAVVAALGGIAVSSYFALPFSGLVTDTETQKWVLWISVILAVSIPFIAIIRLLVKMVTGRPYAGKKWLNAVLATLFILGIFGLFWVGSAIGTDFAVPYSRSYTIPIQQPANDTLIIRQTIQEGNNLVLNDSWEQDWDESNKGFRFRDDSTIALSNIRIRFQTSPDSLYHIIAKKAAQGRNYNRAKMFAEALDLKYEQVGNTIYIPNDFLLTQGHPFRGQKLTIEVQIPVGKVFRTENCEHSFIKPRTIKTSKGHFRYIPNNTYTIDNGTYYEMKTDGPVEVNADHTTEDTDQLY